MDFGKVHCVGWVVAVRDPGLVLLRKEAHAMDDANTNANNAVLGDGILGNVGKLCSLEQARNKEFEPCDGCHSKAMAV